MQRITRVGTVVLAAGCALLAGCQRHGPAAGQAAAPSAVTVTPGPDGVESVMVAEAGPGKYRFEPSDITLHPGRIRITFRNTDVTPHNFTFSTLQQNGHRIAVPTLRGGGEQSVDFTVNAPGQYQFVCTLHQALGQTGTLTVER
jgi:plastocyanin